MGLFKKKGRADIEAWAKALIQGYKKGMPVDRSVLEKETDQSFRNDCRIIKESIQIVMRSSDYDIREKRKKLIEERYQHLKILLPFADSEQLKLSFSFTSVFMIWGACFPYNFLSMSGKAKPSIKASNKFSPKILGINISHISFHDIN